MASEITLLLQQGWGNLGKNKVLWVFGSLNLIDPLIRLLFPIPQYDDIPSALSYIALNLAFAYLTILSYAGILVAAYCIVIEKPLDIKTVFQSSTKIFWRVVGLLFVLALIVSPCFLMVFIVSYKEPFQITDFAHNFFFLRILLSIFAAMSYFPTTVIITNDFKIGKSLKTAWAIFTSNFLILAIVGFGLDIAAYLITIIISIVTMLVQNSFNFAVLSKLDIITPYLVVNRSNFYNLVSALNRVFWRTFSASIFTLAYLKYSTDKINEQAE